jgi:serine/threonine protein kinase
VEEYLAHLPELSGDEDAVLDLIAHERLLRRERGESPTAEEYQRRFPAFAVAIRLQFDVEEMADALSESDADVLSDTSSLDLRPAAGNSDPVPKRETIRSREEPPPPRLPQRFQQFRFLGEGAFGQVWEAWDTVLERRVAIKIPMRNYREPGTWELFVREARAAAKLNHPHICQIYELVEDHDPPFLVLEFVPGPTLTEHQRTAGPLPIQEACRVVSAAARALHHAHERGVVHRDVKPDNIKLPDNAVKVLDFGLARLLDGQHLVQSSGQAIRGTPAYLSPEQTGLTRHPVGPASDQFSLGVVFYELLTGRRPFDADNRGVMETLVNIVRQPPASPRSLRSEIDAALAAIVLRTLEKRPQDRFPSLAALADSLDGYQAGKRSAPPSPSRRRRLLGLAALAGAVLMILAGTITALILSRTLWPGKTPEPAPQPRARLGTDHVLGAIKEHLEHTDRRDRSFKRYLTLTHLHNDPQLTDNDLQQVRAAATVAVNSLHWQSHLVRLDPIDPEHTVLAIDLNELGWESDGMAAEWDQLIAAYPYGLRHASAERLGEKTQFLARQIQGLLGRPCVAFLRADWFTSTALQEPHYGRLLHLPNTLPELETKLGLNIAENVRRGQLVCAALSPADRRDRRRLLERHVLAEGRALWRTYDRPPGEDGVDPTNRPLGALAAPGQVLFHLPNGLPAFLSVDAEGRRQTDARPADVACPAASSSHLERTALSCIACHVAGPLGAENANRLYPDDITLRQRLEADRGLVALVRARAGGLDGVS